MERKLAWKDEKKFMGWACSNCGWVYPNPTREELKGPHDQFVKAAFEVHACQNFRKKPIKQ